MNFLSKCRRSSLIAVLLLACGATQAAPIANANGYFGSATWYTGWGNPLVTHSVGPYLTYGDCYTAWMDLMHSNPQWFLQSATPCTLHATHQPLLSLSFSVLAQIGGPDKPIGTEEAVRIAREVDRVRREFNADAYEAALRRIR